MSDFFLARCVRAVFAQEGRASACYSILWSLSEAPDDATAQCLMDCKGIIL